MKISQQGRHYLLPLLVLIVLAGILRARLNFSSEMIPGINGGYYPLLVRNLLEYGAIRYPDTPFVYWLEAIFSLVIRLFSGMTLDQSILLASRLADSFIPPLTCIPVFLFASYQLKDKPGSKFMIHLISWFSVLYLAFLLVLTSEMQKNAMGMVWLACFFYSVSRIKEDNSCKYLIISVLFLTLIALTHIGCFAVAFLFILIFVAILLIQSRRSVKVKTILWVLLVLSAMILFSFLLLRHDPDRLHRVISFYLNPLRLFESPYLLILLSGQQPYFGFLFHNFLLINILSIAGLILILFHRSRLTTFEFTFALSLLFLSLLLSSPLLGIEWALRYYLMAFLPIAFASVFVFKTLTIKFQKIFFLMVFVVITGFSLGIGFNASRSPSISEESLAALIEMKEETNIRPNELIIARHGLEWWTGWVLRCRTGKEYCLKKEDWDKYPGIYLLKQLSGNNFPGQQGTGQFAEFPVPGSAEKIYSNSSFVLYKLGRPLAMEYYPGELPLLQGEIKSVTDSELVIRAQGYRQLVILNPSTGYIDGKKEDLKVGMRADVWGRRVPFSLNIKAERIRAY